MTRCPHLKPDIDIQDGNTTNDHFMGWRAAVATLAAQYFAVYFSPLGVRMESRGKAFMDSLTDRTFRIGLFEQITS